MQYFYYARLLLTSWLSGKFCALMARIRQNFSQIVERMAKDGPIVPVTVGGGHCCGVPGFNNGRA